MMFRTGTRPTSLIITLLAAGCSSFAEGAGSQSQAPESDGSPSPAPAAEASTPSADEPPEQAPTGTLAPRDVGSNETLPEVSFELPRDDGASAPTSAPPASGAPGSAPSSDGDDDGTAVVPSCATGSALSAGSQTLSLEHDGVRRTYRVHVPANVDSSRPVPLVVDMHGLTSSATAQASLSGWRDKADSVGFIVAHPQGLDASWNGGDLCCGTSQRNGVDDEGFIRAMVAAIEAAACIDPKRVYATGLSNGGAMSHLLACNAADLFAASAPVSMGNGARPCEPSRPISVVMTRGTRDILVGFNGGLFPSAQADFEQWAALNGCQGEPRTVDDLCQVFDQCNAGVEVKLCALDAGHVLYDNSQGFSVPDVVWQTFERQVLP